MKHRIEHDTMGPVKVPADRYWGAQTQRALEHFRIGPEASMPSEIITAFALVKKAAACANHRLGVLDRKKKNLIVQVCDELLAGSLHDHFPLVVWQSGSGTQTNMNVNEVISNRGHVLAGGTLGQGRPLLHPNDDVNKSQSTNDAFPTAMHIAAYTMLTTATIPAIHGLAATLRKKSRDMRGVVKTGRTHFMDAAPLTLGQEFSGYVSQLDHGLKALKKTLGHLAELALGGTAVGTGLNAPKGFDAAAAAYIARYTGLPFRTADNKFEALAAHDALVASHGALKQLAVSLMKIAGDIRMLASGPRAGLGEIHIPGNEPGSSIMPGKTNPTQAEALTMVCAQVMGNDVAITVGGCSGHFELNVFKPMIIANFLQSARLLADACTSFNQFCIQGIRPDRQRIKMFLDESTALAAALNPHIGYERAAEIAHKALAEQITLKNAALALGYATGEQFDKWVDPKKMIKPFKHPKR
jgi:fumarate hydratase class II